MSSDRDRFRVELDVDAGAVRNTRPEERARTSATATGPFRIALLGDFSGRANRGLVEVRKALATRRPVRVDRDSIDDAVARLQPTLKLALAPGEEAIEITFSSLDDFHPDGLYQRVPHFRALREAGARAAASASILSSPRTPASSQTPVDVLGAILGDAPLPPGGAALAKPLGRPVLEPADGGLSEFVGRAVAPHLVASPDPSEAEVRSRVDAAITAVMRAVLHHPDFQRVEAAWRGAALLVRRLDIDSALQIHLVDVSPEELSADLADGQVDQSGIYRLLVEGSVGTPGMPAWAALVGTFALGKGEEDARLLARLGMVARDAGAPFIGAADAVLAGMESVAATPDPDDWTAAETAGWAELRRSSVAPYIALAFPRLLLRLPYGEHADPCELFTFEELVADRHPDHEEFLWGSGGLAGALLLGEGFADMGWSLRPGREISGLPLHVYRVAGESLAVPCTEATLSERAADRLLDRGLSPLLSIRDSDTVILPRLQSIAEPAARLIGRWSAPSK